LNLNAGHVNKVDVTYMTWRGPYKQRRSQNSTLEKLIPNLRHFAVFFGPFFRNLRYS